MSEKMILRRSSYGGWVAALCLLATLPCFAQTGPVGWWKLDEGTGTSTADSSGNANNGALVNSPTWIAGRVGPGALSFGGTTSYVNVPNASGSLDNLQSTQMTISAWINASGTGGSGSGRILEKGGWFFAMSTSGASPVVRFTVQDTGGFRSSTVVTLNTWVHVAATWDGTGAGSGIHVYVNGVLADGDVNAGTGSPGSDVGSASIGNRASDAARGFAGSLDEIRVYNRVLSAAEIQALADSTAPGAPSGLSATATSSTNVNLSWSASTDNVAVTGYLLERCQGSGCSSFAQIAAPSGTTYSDAGLTASTSYSYRVRATDANSNLSGYSNTASATTAAGGDTQPPTAPTNLAVLASSSAEVDLAWGAATDNVGVTNYLIERCSGSGCSTFSQIGTIAAPPYYDTTITAATGYSYRVRAQDGAGNLGPYSNVISITSPVSSPDCN